MTWFRNLSKYVKEFYGPTIFYMDSASYHKNLLNPWPVMGGKNKEGKYCWQRDKVIAWLRQRGTELSKDLIADDDCRPAPAGKNMIELFEIVNANRPEPRYEVYEIAEADGHKIIFTPPYSPLSNPIEKIWAIIKNRIRKGEKRPNNMNELDEMLVASMRKVTQKSWMGAYKATRAWEDKMYATDDNFVDESPGEDLVDDEDPGFGLNVCESDVEESDDE